MTTRNLRSLLVACAIVCLWPSRQARSEQARSDDAVPLRSRFSAALSEISLGATSSEVLRTLGPPDRVRHTDIDTPVRREGVTAIWYYGVHCDSGFPTWGRVYFAGGEGELTRDMSVVAYYGSQKPSKKLSGLSESQVRHVLGAIGAHIECDAGTFNPRDLIRAVNALQAIGKERALVAIDEFLRVSPEEHAGVSEKVRLILRTLFDIPDRSKEEPVAQFGAYRPMPPPGRKLPLSFPIVVIDDIPLLAVQGYSREGPHPPLENELRTFARQGIIRTDLLRPSSDPWHAYEQALQDPNWSSIAGDLQVRAHLAVQIVRLLENERPITAVSPRETGSQFEAALALVTKDGWRVLRERQRKLRVRWDDLRQQYVRDE